MTQTHTNFLKKDDSLTYQQIFRVWFPLALSWMLMLIENPFLNGVLARLPGPEQSIAAFGIIFSIAVVIESPIVPLLTTSTALTKNSQHFAIIRRFSVMLLMLTVGLHALLSWTPLFDLIIIPVINMPEELVELVRMGLRAMVPWSGFVAWRRFNQGILIRSGRSDLVGRGTIVRLVGLTITSVGLGFLTRVPPVLIGALSANVGTLLEAVYATIITRPLIRQQFLSPSPSAEMSNEEKLTYPELIRFHTPLFLSSLIFFLTRPMVSAALGRAANPTLSLAAWPVLMGLLSIVRAPIVAFPTVVVALADRKDALKPLRKFAIGLSFFGAGLFALVAFTPLNIIYFRHLIGVDEVITQTAISGAIFALLLPLIGTFSGFLRGVLTTRKFTVALTLATIGTMLTMGLVLLIGVSKQLPGVALGSAATSISYIAEVTILFLALRWLDKRESASPV
ncbi:MAG: hypothetical protein JW750_11850 [Anaerolineaceae bacterium]|nr:hypothetical protein [Anaerolineaceae bacterium]